MRLIYLHIIFNCLILFPCKSQRPELEKLILAESIMAQVRRTSDPAQLVLLSTQVLSLDSANTSALAYRAFGYQFQGKFSESLNDCDAFLKKHPRSSFSIERAIIKKIKGDSLGCWQDLHLAIERSAFIPTDCEKIASYAKGNPRAKGYFERMVKANRDNYVAYYGLGDILEKSNPVEAARLYSLAVLHLESRIPPEIIYNRWLYWRKANLHFKIGNYAPAIDAITQCILLYPEDSTYYRDRAEFYAASGDMTKVCADIWYIPELPVRIKTSLHCDFKDASNRPSQQWINRVESTKQCPATIRNRGIDSLALQSNIAGYSRAITIWPDNTLALKGRGLCYIQRGKNEAAMADFDKIIQLFPGDACSINQRASIKREMGYLEQALIDANLAISMDSSQPEYLVTRASIKNLKNDLEGAKSDLLDALVLNPYYSEAWFERSLLESNKKNLHEALKCVQQAIEVEESQPFVPVYSVYYYKCASIYEKLEMFEKALSMLEKAISVDPRNGLYYYRSGEIKAKQKNMSGACDDWKKALKLGYRDAEDLTHYNCESLGK